MAPSYRATSYDLPVIGCDFCCKIRNLPGLFPLPTCPPPVGLPPGCVTPATRISLFPEGCVAAGEILSGDLVVTRRPDGTLVGEAVTEVRSSTQPCALLETEDGCQLRCSLSHEIMVADAMLPQGRRTAVAELTLSDRLLREDGTEVALTALTREPEGQVIQISLAGPEHLYLSDGLWSHNKAISPWPPDNIF